MVVVEGGGGGRNYEDKEEGGKDDEEGGRRRHLDGSLTKALLIASSSIASPTGVEVPWQLM